MARLQTNFRRCVYFPPMISRPSVSKHVSSQFIFYVCHNIRRRYSDLLRAGPSADLTRMRDEIFRTRLDQPWGPPSLPYNAYHVSSRGGGLKWPGRGVGLPPPSRAEVKERVKTYLSSLSEPSWRFLK